MDHTIKGILIVAAITSILAVGATMVPIMQNSFAHKKVRFKQAERDTNTNININTNSADCNSTSDATASNTNNIDNTACAVAITCHQGSKTVRQTPTPTPGTLEILKDCTNTCPGIAFSIQVTGNNPQPRSFSLIDDYLI